MPGIELNAAGRHQMAECAERLLESGIDAVQSSPQRRTVQSANIIAARCGAAVEIVPAMDEIEMGDWTGRALAELEADPSWQAWNARRGQQCPPGGECATLLQARVVRHLEDFRKARLDARIVIVSHAEPIRVALMHYLGVPLDHFQSVEVEPAGISTLVMQKSRVVVVRMNGKAIA